MKRFNLTLLLVLSLFLSHLLTGCSPAIRAESEPVLAPAPAPQKAETLVITAVGDIMMHDTEIKAGYRNTEGSYDYSSFFQYVSPLLKASDLVIGNLETPLAGKSARYTGYPLFNAPEILAKNLKEAGFNIVSTANNHCLDRGEKGLLSTLRHLDEAGLQHAGTYANPEEKDKLLTLDIKGVKIAFLSYTFGSNGISLPATSPAAVNYLEPEQIEKDIAKAQVSGAKLIILALHFGQEYQPYPNAQQKQLVQAFFKAGAHVIIGHHPHVLQPPSIDSGLVFYSLGNFVSDQNGMERKSSVILNLHFTVRPETGEPQLQKASYIPIWTHRYLREGRTTFRVLPVEPALTSIQMGQNDYFSRSDIATLEKSWNYVTGHLRTGDPRIRLQELPIPLNGLQQIQTWE